MRCKLIALVLGWLLTTLVPASAKTFALTDAHRAAILAELQKKLKDPESARLGDVYAGPKEATSVFVCGYVNAKNSYGGYVGMTPFNGLLTLADDNTPRAFHVVGIGGDNKETAVVMVMCQNDGLLT